MRRETSPSVMFLLSAGSSADLVSLSRLWFPHWAVFAPTSSLTIEIHSHRRAFRDVFFISVKGFRASGMSLQPHSTLTCFLHASTLDYSGSQRCQTLSALAAEKASLSNHGTSPGGGVTSIWNISVLSCLERSGAICSEVHGVLGHRLRRPHSQVGNRNKSIKQICMSRYTGHMSARATRRVTTGRVQSASRRGVLPTAVG